MTLSNKQTGTFTFAGKPVHFTTNNLTSCGLYVPYFTGKETSHINKIGQAALMNSEYTPVEYRGQIYFKQFKSTYDIIFEDE